MGGASNRLPSAAEGSSPVKLGQSSQFGTGRFHTKKGASFESLKLSVAPMWRFMSLMTFSSSNPHMTDRATTSFDGFRPSRDPKQASREF